MGASPFWYGWVATTDKAFLALASASSEVTYLSTFGQLAVSGVMIFTDGQRSANFGPSFWLMNVVSSSGVHWAPSQVAM